MGDPRKLDRALLGAALFALTLSGWLGTRPIALDPDAMNLAYGMRHFDITHFTPHAPGYLVYIWTLRAVHALTLGGGSLLERVAIVQLVALLFALGTVATVYATARRMRLPPGSAGWAAMVIAVHPILVFHAIDAQTHTSEAFASALLLWGAVGYRETPAVRPALLLGLLLAFGSALRPSFIVFGIPVVVWTIGVRRFSDLVMAGLASIAGAVAWILPTVATWRPSMVFAIRLTSSTSSAALTSASWRRFIGVVPPWLATPSTVMSHQRMPTMPSTTPIWILSSWRKAPCSICSSRKALRVAGSRLAAAIFPGLPPTRAIPSRML